MKTLIIFYDNYCPNCTKFTNLIQKLDWLQLLEIEPLRNDLTMSNYKDINLALAKQQMASYTNKWHYGYVSLYLIFIRLPIFWIMIPLLFILKISRLGQYLYVKLALQRKIIPIHCDENSCRI
jgi:predicted DCC family thiol-disulfide oxidoreductase YuxK